ncbi:MAG: AsmA family protein [Deltaproteobacteria bacterium]|nr:AsmA family protein [Deltaproteobacteria bacterium]
MRKAAIAAAIVFIAAAVLVLVLPRVISLEPFKPRIAALLEEKTGRKASFSKVTLSLFPGIGLKIEGLTISGDPGHTAENLLSVPEAEARVALAKLLAGRVEFGRLIFRRPEVVFRKYKDGTHSLTRIAERMSGKDGAAPQTAKEPVSVTIRTVSIEEAKLHLFLEDTDGKETRWDIEPFTFRLDGIGGKRNEFMIETRIAGVLRGEIRAAGSMTREEAASAGLPRYRLAADGKIFGQQMSAEGTIPDPPGSGAADVTVVFPKIEMAKIPGMFAAVPEALAKASPEGLASLKVDISGDVQAAEFKAEADLTRTGWTVLPGLRKFMDMPCTVTAQGRRFPDRFVVSNAELKFPPLSATGEASYSPSTGRREWAASARIASLSEFARSRGNMLGKWSPSGQLTASGKGYRPAASARETWNVSLDLGNVAARFPEDRIDLGDVDGHVEISSGKIEFQPLAGLFNGQRFSLKGSVSLGPAPAGQASLYMPYLDPDKLFPPDESGDRAKPAKRDTDAGKAPVGTEISARGSVRIDAGKIKGLEFRNLSGTGRYERGTLTVDEMTARMYGGDADISGRIRLKPQDRDFRVRVAAKNLQINEVLSRTTSLKDFIAGAGSLSADLGGSSRDFAEFSRTAGGSGSFRVTGGKIRGVDLLASATGLAGLGGVYSPKGGPGEGKSKETSFSDLAADFRIEGGKIRTESLKISSGKFSLEGKAAVGFDRSFDFRGMLFLPKELLQSARAAKGKFLVGPSGRVEIPLSMSGSVTAPGMAIDAETLAKGIAKRAIRKLLDGNGDAEPPAPPGTESGKPPERPAPEKKLKDLLERFLPGKK